MPKISYYDNNKSNDSSLYTRSTDPRTWAWNYPVEIKKIGDFILGADAQIDNGFAKYGIFLKDKNNKFLNEKNVLSAIEIQEMPGAAFGVPEIKKVAVIHNVTTIPEARGKGLARGLYEFLLEKYKVVFSDTELFSDKDKDNKTVSIWKNFLPKLGTVLNFDTKTKTYSEFDPVIGTQSENIRFVVVADKNIVSTMKESFSNWMKKGVTGAALTGLMAMPMISASTPEKNIVNNKQQIQQKKNDFKPSYTSDDVYNLLSQPQSNKINQDSEVNTGGPININIIADIESGGNANIGRNRKGATGLCQLKKAAWDEAAKSMFGKHGHKTYSYEKCASNGKINKMIANHYFNVVLPKHLEAFDLPITKETLLASYNWGSNNVKKSIRNHGNNWLKFAPEETQNYLNSYNNIENSK